MEGEIKKYESSSYATAGPENATKSVITRHQLPYHVTRLAENELIQKLMRSDNDLLPYILNDLLTQLSIFLEDRYELVHLGARTLRDPEEPEWEVIVIIVNADFGFKGFEHRFEVEDKIEKIVENVIDGWREKVHKDDVTKVKEANAIISVIIDET